MEKLLEKEISEIRLEKSVLKQKWSNAFLHELDLIIEKCFLKPKSKKEHFITKDKIELELIKLLQSQKKFTTKNNFRSILSTQAVFDLKENAVAKILKINFEDKKVEGYSIFQKIIIRDFDEVMFFDVYSVEFPVFFEKQKQINDSFNYSATFRFLTHVEKPLVQKIANYFTFTKKTCMETEETDLPLFNSENEKILSTPEEIHC